MTTIDESNRDHDLAVAAIRGDAEAFEALYELLSPRVFNLVLRSVQDRATAEDVCQEVWLKAHREIRKLNSPRALRTWLFRMASRACIDYSRSRAYRERSNPEVTEEMVDAPAYEPEHVAERRAELRVMWEALAAMPPRQSLALYLKQAEGCSYEEIGRILSCPRTAVETLLFRARQGFSRVHQQLQHDPESSCKLIGQTMAAVLDHEATQFQERAVEAHLSDCRPCRIQMQTMGRGAAGYAWLPMLPAGQQALSSALATGSGAAGAGFGIGRLVCGLLLKAKAASSVAVIIGAVGTTAVAAAAAGLTPTPADVVALVQESGGVGPETGAEDPSDQRSGRPAETFNPGSGGGSGQGGDGVTVETPGGLPPAGLLDPAALPPEDGILTGDGLAGSLGGVTDTVNTTLDGVGEVVNGTVNGVIDTLNGAVQDALDTVDDTLNDPVGAVTGVLEDPVGTLDDLTGTVDDAIEGTTGTTDQTVDDTTDLVDGLTGGATEGATGTVDDLADDLTDPLDDLLGPPEEESPCIPVPLLVTC
jgi:RNA polymerase sigma-70 factor (ECF subfamily)